MGGYPEDDWMIEGVPATCRAPAAHRGSAAA